MSRDKQVVRYFEMTVTLPRLLSTSVLSPKQSPSFSSFSFFCDEKLAYKFGDHDFFTFFLITEVALTSTSEDHVELAADGSFE